MEKFLKIDNNILNKSKILNIEFLSDKRVLIIMDGDGGLELDLPCNKETRKMIEDQLK